MQLSITCSLRLVPPVPSANVCVFVCLAGRVAAVVLLAAAAATVEVHGRRPGIGAASRTTTTSPFYSHDY